LNFFGGVTAQIVSDNLKAGVTKACFYDPEINRTYADMAAHYDTAFVPARPYKPKDKAKAEGGVLLAERWILARLRNRQFFSLSELNAAIRPLLIQLNDSLGSSFKCNTQSPLGIGCCDGHTKQAPQRRGTWRDISRA